MGIRADDGRPAFAHAGRSPYNDEQQGLTQRQWFAGQALAYMYSGSRWQPPEHLAAGCYEIADAMIKGSDK